MDWSGEVVSDLNQTDQSILHAKIMPLLVVFKLAEAHLFCQGKVAVV